MIDKKTRDAFCTSNSLSDLESRLAENGIVFATHTELIILTNSVRNWLASDYNSVFLKTPPKDSFPVLKISTEKTTYLLHGIAHGGYPGAFPEDDLVRRISERAAAYNHPSENEDCLYEENLRVIFSGFDPSKELKDISGTNKKTNPIFAAGIAVAAIPLVIPAILFILLQGCAMDVYMRVLRNPKKYLSSNLYFVRRAMKDETGQAKLFEFMRATEFPQPLNLELNYLGQQAPNFKTALLPFHLLNGKFSGATFVERSKWTADKLREYAAKQNTRRLHYIGGAIHIGEIAFFLQHPDYSLDRLKDHITSKPWFINNNS